MSNSIKSWLVQKQTAFGKDFSNPFIADSLLKTIWFSTYHASHASCYSNEALVVPKQTATGKEISNPFMAVSLDLSRLATTLNRLERSIQNGINNLFVKSLFNLVQVILLACSIPISWAYAFHQDKASSVRVPVANVTLFSLAQLL
ncbi:hypothetical protein Tco_0469823 [Tanacetum coccineum]